MTKRKETASPKITRLLIGEERWNNGLERENPFVRARIPSSTLREEDGWSFFSSPFPLVPAVKKFHRVLCYWMRRYPLQPVFTTRFLCLPAAFPSLSLARKYFTKTNTRGRGCSRRHPLPSRSEYQEQTWPRPVAGLVDFWPKRAQSRCVASVLPTAACLWNLT